MMPIFFVSLFLFVSGLYCVFSSKNLVKLLIGIEFILNAGVVPFVFFDKDGQGTVNAIFISATAGIVFVIYLSIFKKYFDLKQDVSVESIEETK